MDSGKAKSSGLGGYPSVSLQMARELAQRLRDARASGVDPQIAKRQRDEQRKLAENRVKTFSDCAADYIALTEPSWKSAKHAQQWRNTLAQYAEPVIGAMPVADVAAEHVLKILKPIWQTKAETASRLRGRIELILDWAAANGRRTGDNPARLKGHLEHMLPRLRSGTRQHHAAMHYEDVPALLDALEDHGGMSRYALEFLILCASRTGEVVGATWSEIDIGKRIWTIPKQRMKAGVEHRVPLSDRAIAILELIRPFTGDTYVFPGGKKDKPISNMAMMMLLRRMGHEEITVHGFLMALHKASPIRINKLLTDNGKEFADRLFGSREHEPSGNHEFDRLCREPGTDHKLTKPRPPRTNGMVEGFNGRIADVLNTHRFNSREDMQQTLQRYVALYNHQLPQSALGSKTPMQATKRWHQERPDLFHKRPCDRPRCDI